MAVKEVIYTPPTKASQHLQIKLLASPRWSEKLNQELQLPVFSVGGLRPAPKSNTGCSINCLDQQEKVSRAVCLNTSCAHRSCGWQQVRTVTQVGPCTNGLSLWVHTFVASGTPLTVTATWGLPAFCTEGWSLMVTALIQSRGDPGSSPSQWRVVNPASSHFSRPWLCPSPLQPEKSWEQRKQQPGGKLGPPTEGNLALQS